MPHSFSDCPLRSSCLLITNHSTQSIVTATDEVLDLLGYSMNEILGHSMHSLQFQPLSKLSLIPECTIKHANGESIPFQICIHQNPLGASNYLDYWLIKRQSTQQINTNTAIPSLSIIRLSSYGTIEQVQPSNQLKQPLSELIGRPVMAFVYQDDVEPLCASLAKICSIHKQQEQQDPLFIRWSKLPCLITTTPVDYESSLNYDWMSFTLASMGVLDHSIKPICILRPMQVEDDPATTKDIVIHDGLFAQWIDYCKHMYQQLIQAVKESKNASQIYLLEFYQHIMSNLVDLLTCYHGDQNVEKVIQVVDHQDTLFHVPLANTESSLNKTLWDLVKSNPILQTSFYLLEFTGLLHQKRHIDHLKFT